MNFKGWVWFLPGSFVGLGSSSIEKQNSVESRGSGDCVYENEHLDLGDDTDESFNDLLMSLGTTEVIEE